MTVNVAGASSIAVFYTAVMAVGIWAAWKHRSKSQKRASEQILVGKRDVGILLGSFTMTATWVGGGYINGTAETIYDSKVGLLWTLGPFGYSISVMICGLMFAKKMRRQGYLTMIDPFQLKFGKAMGALLYLPAVMSESMFCGAILSALGSTLFVILDINFDWSVIISALIAVVYTMIGGLYSVAYTDVVQLICLFLGMWISVPFVLTNEAVGSIVETAHTGEGGWYGTWSWDQAGAWFDLLLQTCFGGIAWQVIFQRIFASDTPKTALNICLIGGACSMPMMVPSILIGAAAGNTNWTMVSYMNGTSPASLGQERMILPIALLHLTPTAVAFLGLGSISAAVMSSVDASFLSMSSMFIKNVYEPILRKNPSERELVWILRLGIFLFAALSVVFALTIKSVFALWYLCTDFVFVVVFPQLFSVIHLNPNAYGSLCGYILGIILRLGGGLSLLDFKPFIHYPGGDNFPIKTFSMLVSFTTINVVSLIMQELFSRKIIPAKYDIFNCNLANGGRSIDKKLTTTNESVSNTEMDKMI